MLNFSLIQFTPVPRGCVSVLSTKRTYFGVVLYFMQHVSLENKIFARVKWFQNLGKDPLSGLSMFKNKEICEKQFISIHDIDHRVYVTRMIDDLVNDEMNEDSVFYVLPLSKNIS